MCKELADLERDMFLDISIVPSVSISRRKLTIKPLINYAAIYRIEAELSHAVKLVPVPNINAS